MKGSFDPVTLMALTAAWGLWLAAALVASRTPGGSELQRRMLGWALILLPLSLALVAGPGWVVALLALTSFLALREFLSFSPGRHADRVVLWLVFLAVPVQFLLIGAGRYGFFIILVPVYMFMVLPMAMVLKGQTQGFLAALARLQWALAACVFALGHAAYVAILPEALAVPPAAPARPGAGPVTGSALLIFLLTLTAVGDIGQYVVGRALGGPRVAPKVSPGKTWSGVAGGLLVTTLVGAVLAPWLTPFGPVAGAAIGGLLGLAGFFGDVTLSAIKRDVGIKDSGTLIPWHGGLLDRLDSLLFTAPLFLHVTRFFAYS